MQTIRIADAAAHRIRTALATAAAHRMRRTCSTGIRAAAAVHPAAAAVTAVTAANASAATGAIIAGSMRCAAEKTSAATE